MADQNALVTLSGQALGPKTYNLRDNMAPPVLKGQTYGFKTYNTKQTSVIKLIPGRSIYGGFGYIAGKLPGIVTVDGVAAQRPVEVRLRDMHRTLIARVWSSADGTYRIDMLDPYLKYDVIARDEPDGVYNDVIVSDVWAWTDYEIIVRGSKLPPAFGTPFARTYELTGGTLPYSIAPESVIPAGVTVTLTDRKLEISADGDPNANFTLIIADSSGLTKTLSMFSYNAVTAVETGDKYWKNVQIMLPMTGTNGSTSFPDINMMTSRTWTPTNVTVSTTGYAYGDADFSLNSAKLTAPDDATLSLQGKDWCIEAFVQTGSTFTDWMPISTKDYVEGSYYWSHGFAIMSDRRLRLSVGPGTNSSVPVNFETAAGTVPPNSLVHLAAQRVTRNGSVYFEIFMGTPGQPGTRVFSQQSSTGYPGNGPRDFFVGALNNPTPVSLMSHMRGYRLTTGMGRYPDSVSYTAPKSFQTGMVASLHHFNGTNAQTSFNDESQLAWTQFGTAQLSDAQFKFGGTSLKVYGADSGMRTAAGILNPTDKFCIDGWIWCDPAGGAGGSSNPGNYTLCGQGGDGGAQDQMLAINSSGVLSFYRGPNIGSEGSKSISGGSLARGQWHHVMLTYDGSKLRLYANGSKINEVAATQGWINTGYPFTVGYQLVQYYPEYRAGHNGYIDEFQIVKGSPVVVGDSYAVPAAPYHTYLVPTQTDNFDTNTLSSYTQVADSAGTWSISGGKITQMSGSQSLMIRNGANFVDGEVSCIITEAADAGLVLRCLDNNTYYLAAIYDASGYASNKVRLYKRQYGSYYLLSEASIPTFTRGTSHKLAFSVKGSDFKISFDDVVYIHNTNGDITASGGCGIRGQDNTNTFDSFTWTTA